MRTAAATFRCNSLNNNRSRGTLGNELRLGELCAKGSGGGRIGVDVEAEVAQSRI
jgi:hypothetical protein